MAQVLALPTAETGRLDPRVLNRLRASMGADRCRQVLADAAFEITDRLIRFDRAAATGDATAAARLARGVAAMADGIGAVELAAAARAAADSHRRGCAVARAATAQRLSRCGDAMMDDLLGAALAADP
ncbi:hypothetical protein GE300_07600 [Rhodobacteraceae bacterium 2CG4]|uniref:Hpt domain-containing protein n=1 Tax=Halovulum marinum TaxID=2662447 RepID=A0A6L5YZ32_9RHOB|nr:hypothetical protein [Halovulum marinum]MSU89478.1 hypothetical protein [Halovulum marinum]